MSHRKRLNLLNILYYCVQRCIASSKNSNLDTKSHLSTEIVLQIKEIGKNKLSYRYLSSAIRHLFTAL